MSADSDLALSTVLGWSDPYFPRASLDRKNASRERDRLGAKRRVNRSSEAKDSAVTSDRSGSGTPRPQTQPSNVTSKNNPERERGNELNVGKARAFLIGEVTQTYTASIPPQHPARLWKSIRPVGSGVNAEQLHQLNWWLISERSLVSVSVSLSLYIYIYV